MISRIAVLALFAAPLAACQATPKDPPVWVRTDGRSLAGRPELQAKFQVDKTICEGEMAKVAGGAAPIYYQGLGGLIMASAVAQQRSEMYKVIGVGCMAERGYVLSTASKVQSTADEFRRVSGGAK